MLLLSVIYTRVSKMEEGGGDLRKKGNGLKTESQCCVSDGGERPLGGHTVHRVGHDGGTTDGW